MSNFVKLKWRERETVPLYPHVPDEQGRILVSRKVFGGRTPLDDAIAVMIEASIELDEPTIDIELNYDVALAVVRGKRQATDAEREAGLRQAARDRELRIEQARATLAEYGET